MWRLIPCFAAPGQVQMAVDNWLLEQHRKGLQPPCLRFYIWQPAALSLGYHQRQYPTAWERITYEGQPLDIVRRPTGGRAVLHQGDLTYAVVTSDLTGTRSQNYQQICQFLIEGWRKLGVNLHYGAAKRGYIHNPNCFGTATAADLVTDENCKLIGSAQLRRGRAILQHGSMQIGGDRALYQQIFAEPLKPPTLPWKTPPESLIPHIITTLTAAAATCFQVQFSVQPLTSDEWEEVRQGARVSHQ
ncbi:MAG: lipoate--protein ligase family protein [Jaaginema sp. PMC 1079.18]|nr:lipoate--protein ligase family protein [Jaaginema sp. PMC 1080.18]MEC4850314.1 lipoate--protein ligase family protein [Jaaginema sp. PMC 1079.18]MEC4869050.1 lipoate--protein ligase family protein [Jaaginema sp. PMC 1078.18]